MVPRSRLVASGSPQSSRKKTSKVDGSGGGRSRFIGLATQRRNLGRPFFRRNPVTIILRFRFYEEIWKWRQVL